MSYELWAMSVIPGLSWRALSAGDLPAVVDLGQAWLRADGGLPFLFEPAGVTLAEQLYQAYYEAFKERPGFPGWSAEEWIGQMNDPDFRPGWSLLAGDHGTPAGFVIGDAGLTAEPVSGYIRQIGVVPAQRRRGLASALLVESMRRRQQDGMPCASHVVNLNNPGASGADRRLDFREIADRRGRGQSALSSAPPALSMARQTARPPS